MIWILWLGFMVAVGLGLIALAHVLWERLEIKDAADRERVALDCYAASRRED